MTGEARAFWGLLALTLAVYLAMVLWTLPAIQRAADGLRPFDLRPLGYTAAEARAVLAALGAEGRALYLGPQRWLDTGFPLLLALTLTWSYRRLARGGPPWVWAGPAAVAWAGAASDLLENARVRGLLAREAAAVPDAAVAAASRASMLKSAFDTAAVLLLILLAIRAWRRGRA